MNKTAQSYLDASLKTIRRVGWLPFAVLLAHEICAHVVDGYRLWPSVDIPFHFFGGLAVAFFVSGAIRIFSEHHLIREPDPLIHIAVAFALACTAAVFWEFAEWIADHTIGSTCQVGLDDTILDLLMGAVGGAVCTLPMVIRIFRGK
jgi:hypothetical protein